jgi:energy-coupling factor transport system ATP-binding protein
MIDLKHVSYVYQSGTPFESAALNDVNLHIDKNTFTGLIGHTGSGKSTLIQHLNALLKPTSGQIWIDGVEITAPNVNLREVRKKVGLVFQYPEHQLFEETVYKDIAFGPKNLGLTEAEIKERVYEAIEIVGIDESQLERSPFDISGGQKRRVAIAGVLAMKPSVLVLDEPTAGLDPAGRDEILNQIRGLHQRFDMTVILVSHSMEDVARIADNIIVMNHGKVAFYDTVNEVFSHAEELREIGLNIPQVTEIMRGLKKKGYPVDSRIHTVEEAKAEILKLLQKKKLGDQQC